MHDLDDQELKKSIVNRNKRLYYNILNQLQVSREKGIISKDELEQYKSHYNDMVIEESKEEYLKIKSQEEKYFGCRC